MGRLGADASRVVEAARDLARKHRHEALEPEHLLGALLRDDRMERVLTERAVDRRDLRERLGACLVVLPTSGLYRDANVEPVPSDALQSLIARAGAGRLVALLRPVTFAQLAHAACSEPRLALLLRAASTAVASPRDALAQAKTFALSRREGWVSVFHLFHVLVEQPSMTNALRDAHVDRDALLGRIVRRLDDEPRVDDLVRDGLDKIEGLHVLLAGLLRTKAIDVLLTEMGGSVFSVMRGLVRSAGESVDDDTVPEDGDGDVDVVFHDDDFTTQEFVVGALEQCFAIPGTKALRLMLKVHRNGAAVVTTCAASQARWRLEKARSLALEAAMPLRISWRTHTPPSEPEQDDA